METEIGGWLWGFIDVILVAILAGGLIYATVMWRRRKLDPAQTEERERKTRELFGRR